MNGRYNVKRIYDIYFSLLLYGMFNVYTIWRGGKWCAMKFITLYDEYFDDVYRYVYFKTGNSWDADDLVSEIFRKAYEKFNTIKDNPKAWLFTIVRNTITDHYRKKKVITIGDDLDQFSYPSCFEQEYETKEQLRTLKESLHSLTKEELELINLRYFAEMPFHEIGKLIGKSEDAVKMQIYRITKKLKVLLNDHNDHMEGSK